MGGPRRRHWGAGALFGLCVGACGGDGGSADVATDTDTDAGTVGLPTASTATTGTTMSSATPTVGSDGTVDSSSTATVTSAGTSSGVDTGTSDSGTAADACGNGAPDPGEACDDGNQEDGDGCNNDCVVSGTVLWSHVFASGFGGDDARDVAVGADGEIYVTGFRSQADASTDIWTRRYSSEGAIEWTAERSSGDGTNDDAHAVAFADGAVYVSASFGTPAPSGVDIWYGRYSPEGDLVWEQTASGAEAGTDRALSVAVGPDGVPVVAGRLTQAAGGANVWVRKAFPETGLSEWTVTFSGLAGLSDRADDVAVNSMGAVVVGGVETNALLEQLAWVRKYDAAGIEVWTQTFAGGDAAGDRAWSIATNDADDIFVGGYLGDMRLVDGRRWWVRAYDTNAQILWEHDDPGETGEGARVRSVAVLGNGDVIAVGADVVGGVLQMIARRYDPTGVERWVQRFPNLPDGKSIAKGVAPHPDGGAYIVGAVDFGVDGDDAWIGRIAP